MASMSASKSGPSTKIHATMQPESRCWVLSVADPLGSICLMTTRQTACPNEATASPECVGTAVPSLGTSQRLVRLCRFFSSTAYKVVSHHCPITGGTASPASLKFPVPSTADLLLPIHSVHYVFSFSTRRSRYWVAEGREGRPDLGCHLGATSRHDQGAMDRPQHATGRSDQQNGGGTWLQGNVSDTSGAESSAAGMDG